MFYTCFLAPQIFDFTLSRFSSLVDFFQEFVVLDEQVEWLPSYYYAMLCHAMVSLLLHLFLRDQLLVTVSFRTFELREFFLLLMSSSRRASSEVLEQEISSESSWNQPAEISSSFD